jgi:hypothetical protein
MASVQPGNYQQNEEMTYRTEENIYKLIYKVHKELKQLNSKKTK